MPLNTSIIQYDGLTSDPVAPSNGSSWFRSDLNEMRSFVNGQTVINGIINGSQVVTSSPTVDQHNYNPTGFEGNTKVLRLSPSFHNLEITGLVPKGVWQELIIINYNTIGNDIKIKVESASSTASNRFRADADFAIKAGGSIKFIYDLTSSRWRVQGIV